MANEREEQEPWVRWQREEGGGQGNRRKRGAREPWAEGAKEQGAGGGEGGKRLPQ